MPWFRKFATSLDASDAPLRPRTNHGPEQTHRCLKASFCWCFWRAESYAGAVSSPPKATLPAAAPRRVFRLALPIVGGMVSQNVLNLVDTYMVGTQGPRALAAVSAAGMINFVAVASIMGLSAAVQTLAARRYGAGQHWISATPLNGALVAAFVLGLPLTALFIGGAPSIVGLVIPDPSVVAIAVPYLVARLLALVPAGLNFAFRGYWNGTNRSHLYMSTLLVMHLINIAGNWVLIYGNLGAPALGAPGAGIASALATAAGTVMYVVIAMRQASANGFIRSRPDTAVMRSLLKLALPSSLQQLLFAGGFTAQFWIIGKLGTLEMAAAGVLINLMLVVVLPGLALGITAASLVSQALGRRNAQEADLWAWLVVRVSLAVAVTLALPLLLAPDAILRPFLVEPAAIELARAPLRIFAATIFIDSAGTVLQQALLGAGANRVVMTVSALCQWAFFLPLAFLVGPVLQYGLVGIWLAQAVYRTLQAGVFAWIWCGKGWARLVF